VLHKINITYYFEKPSVGLAPAEARLDAESRFRRQEADGEQDGIGMGGPCPVAASCGSAGTGPTEA
jgi:hypothetical protein